MTGERMVTLIEGGVTTPRGFLAAATAAGIKKSAGALDMALIAGESDCLTAGVFTTNRVKAAPVRDAMAKLRRDPLIRGILVNSGSANACTGPAGMSDLRAILRASSAALGVSPARMLMASTGVIGERIPLGKAREGAAALAGRLSREAGPEAARAIMTTDTYPKECAVVVETSGGPVTIGGMAKGAGMINPNMATMLAFITTDARFDDPGLLRSILREAVETTLNRIDLDTDTSTNDSVFLMTGGRSAAPLAVDDLEAFSRGLAVVCEDLAMKIAGDTEGASKVVTITVSGARSDREAALAARTVAESPLVKTALHGQDPNWGRIMAALGRSGARFRENAVRISYNGLLMVAGGVRAEGVTEEAAREVLRPKKISLDIDLGGGAGTYRVTTGDLTADYVRINASYRS